MSDVTALRSAALAALRACEATAVEVRIKGRSGHAGVAPHVVQSTMAELNRRASQATIAYAAAAGLDPVETMAALQADLGWC